MKIKLDKIRIDLGTQTRCGYNEDHIQDMVDALERNEPLPDMDVFDDGEQMIMGRGFHRCAAYKRAGYKEADCKVHQGNVDDALHFNASEDTNASPLKRSRDDKINAVKKLLQTKKYSDASSNWLAKTVKLDDEFVTKIRNEMFLEGQNSTSGTGDRNTQTRTGKDGKKRGAHKPRPCKACKDAGTPLCAKCIKKFPNGLPRDKPGKKAKPCRRCLRVGSPACDKCRAKFPKGFHTSGEANSSDHPPEAAIPKRLELIFSSVHLFNSCKTLAKQLEGLLTDLEGTPAWQAAVKQKRQPNLSGLLHAAAKTIEGFSPARACPDCGGEHPPSEDADPCSKCGDKCWQTVTEATYG
jgi:hypothetical protein